MRWRRRRTRRCSRAAFSSTPGASRFSSSSCWRRSPATIFSPAPSPPRNRTGCLPPGSRSISQRSDGSNTRASQRTRSAARSPWRASTSLRTPRRTCRSAFPFTRFRRSACCSTSAAATQKRRGASSIRRSTSRCSRNSSPDPSFATRKSTSSCASARTAPRSSPQGRGCSFSASRRRRFSPTPSPAPPMRRSERRPKRR